MVALLDQRELAPLDLAEAGGVALGGDLADDGRVNRGQRGLAVGLPKTSVKHDFHDVLAPHRQVLRKFALGDATLARNFLSRFV